ncbi:MAG: protein-glutamate O-methyltransferase CheR [Chlamydiia bacterium]|nr:protein-glutamate O-methyltransferase CheR [Chlamydiia bacterium]
MESTPLLKIQLLIKELIGLDPLSMGEKNWIAAITRRIQQTGEQGIDAYLRLVLRSVEEQQELINEVVIPETWFFREKRGLDALRAYVQEDIARFRQGMPLRVLSLGCSTGEEPYSIVITLLETGLPVGTFRVEGVDVSTRSLEIARRARYGEYSFRGESGPLIRKYFRGDEGQKMLIDLVRFVVRFRRESICTYPQSWSDKYDVIFCRNLLIYLTPELQKDAMRRLAQALTPGGILIVGDSEFAKIPKERFEVAYLQGLRVYRTPEKAAAGER